MKRITDPIHRKLDSIEASLGANTSTEVTLRDLLQRIEAALVVRDPGTAKSMEAYDGLRRQVARSAKDHHLHLMTLVSLSDAIDSGASIDDIRRLIADHVDRMSLERHDDPAVSPEWFSGPTAGEDDHEIVRAAWVERTTSGPVLVRPGEVVAAPENSAAAR